jgi:hypothetical protein
MRANAWEEIGKELKIKRKRWRELTWREDSVSPASFSTICWSLQSGDLVSHKRDCWGTGSISISSISGNNW